MLDRLIEKITRKRFKSVDARLRFYVSVSDWIVAAVSFSLIFHHKLQINTYFGNDRPVDIARRALQGEIGEISVSYFRQVIVFLQDMGLIAALALFTFGWYFLYKRAVRNEIEIATRLFSQFNAPKDWEKFTGREWIPILSVGITVAFFVLAWFIDRIEIYCLVLILLNIFDVRGNSVVRQNIAGHIADPLYIPIDSDLNKPFIMRRRAVAEDYWIKRPHIERIGTMMIVEMIAFMARFSEPIIGYSVPIAVPYVIVMAAIAMNEHTMIKWRRVRDRQLDAIDEDQARAEHQREEEIAAQIAEHGTESST